MIVADVDEQEIARENTSEAIENTPNADDLYSQSSSSESAPSPKVIKPKKKVLRKPMKKFSKNSSSENDSEKSDEKKTSPKIVKAPPPSEIKVPRSHREKTLQKIFLKYDADGDGFLTFADMRSVFSSRGIKDIEIRQWMNEHDSRGQGKISLFDFLEHYTKNEASIKLDPPPHLSPKKLGSQDIYSDKSKSWHGGSYRLGGTSGTIDMEQGRKLRRLFDIYDYDKDGKITQKDLQKVFRQQGRNDVTDDMIVEWINAKDSKKQCAVDLEDFIKSTT
ncbi:hypothetical protein THRCLA_22566 [Thraustotheca clavata]|uniref:EF-hand domain-containing protein n=1 Tax=Thraustotheca clavata TaxID=74557 RepID=A0A1V9YXK8_9STRA|nr:hypothetical protein THRCLA_22566 [Thraustotheca clavata]